MEKTKKSIFQQASEWGIPFGLYLACAGAAFVFSDLFTPLGLVYTLMVVGTPVVVYAFQRKRFIQDDGFSEHAALWMLGIMLFLFGTILASVIMYFLMQYVRPDFMHEQLKHAIETYSSIPELQDSEILTVLKRMQQENYLPSPIQVVFSAFWFITFGGSLVSAITAVIARRPFKRR